MKKKRRCPVCYVDCAYCNDDSPHPVASGTHSQQDDWCSPEEMLKRCKRVGSHNQNCTKSKGCGRKFQNYKNVHGYRIIKICGEDGHYNNGLEPFLCPKCRGSCIKSCKKSK